MQIILYGKTSCGYQRFKCKLCDHTYTFHNRKNKITRERKWFELWIIEGYSIRQLHAISKHSYRKLKEIKRHWLHKSPPLIISNIADYHYLLFDGTYFQHENCLMVALDYHSNTVLSAKYVKRENYHSALEIFNGLRNQGIHPKAITIDGNTSVIRAIKFVWPNIAIQRCIVHIQRQGLSWLRRNPKTDTARQLRNLLLSVTKIKNKSDKQQFINQFQLWEKQFGKFVQSLPKTDKVYSDLQRTRSLIIHALPDMFHYLDDNQIASSTNKIEGYFSKLKSRYRMHCGLRKEHRDNYFKWYIYFINNK